MKITRRNLLRSGLLSITGMAVSPWVRSESFSERSIVLDQFGRIYHSPLLREHLPDQLFQKKTMIHIGYNENPYGPSPSTCEAIKQAVTDREGNRYCWNHVNELAGMIAQKEGVKPEQVLMGPGLSDLLDRTALSLCAGSGNIVSIDPTFMSIVEVARAGGAAWKPVPCNEDGTTDLEAVRKAIDPQTRLVYICNPSNPIGTVIDADDLREFCTHTAKNVPVFIDEAYIEFAQGATQSMLPLIHQGHDILIGRTFSKVMGMAGLRVGYLIGQPSTLNKIQNGGLGICLTTVRGAVAALNDTDFQKMTVNRNTEVKEYLCQQLTSLGYRYIPSSTNFVLFPIRSDGKHFVNKMNEKGIFVRAFDIKNRAWCRVSIGTGDEIQQFVTALKSLS